MWEPQDDTRELVLEVMINNPGVRYSIDTMYFKLIYDKNQRNMVDVKWALVELHKERLILFDQGRYYVPEHV